MICNSNEYFELTKNNYKSFLKSNKQTNNIKNEIESQLFYYETINNQSNQIILYFLGFEKFILQLFIINSLFYYNLYIKTNQLLNISEILVSFMDLLIDSVEHLPICVTIANAINNINTNNNENKNNNNNIIIEKKGFELIYANKQYELMTGELCD